MPVKPASALRIVAIVSTVIPGDPSWAQGPGSPHALVPYSGRLESAGAPASGNFDFRFGLYDSPGADTSELATTPSQALWWEPALAVPVRQGTFSWQLGSATALDNTLFLHNALYLAIAVRPAGASTWVVLQGLQRLTQVPYTVRSDQSDGLHIDTGDTHWQFAGPDLQVASDSRGDGGRAMVMGTGDSLILNYGGDFAGGTQIQSDLKVTGSVTTARLKIPTDQGELTIVDDDGEVIVRIQENSSKGKVTLEDGTDLDVAGTVTWHCPSNMTRIGTWCIDNAASASNVTWDAATLACHNAGKDLCPYSALMACDSLEPTTSECTAATDGPTVRLMWTRDRHTERDDFLESWSNNLVCFRSDNAVLECTANTTETHEYFCCIPGVRE